MKTLLILGTLTLFLNAAFAQLPRPNVAVIGRINKGMERDLYLFFTLYKKPRKIKFFFDSPGGKLESTLRIIATLKLKKIQGYAFECHMFRAASGAASIFQECDERVVYSNSVYGQHKAGKNLPPGSSDIECDWYCVGLDLLRLSTEAHNLGLTSFTYRNSLPKYSEKIKTYYGKQIKIERLANKYVDQKIKVNLYRVSGGAQ